MKKTKTKNVKSPFIKGYEPKSLHFKSGRSLTTNGLTKQDWVSMKNKFKKCSAEDIETIKGILSL